MSNLDTHFFDYLLPAKHFLTMKEVSLLIGLSEQTVLEACENGRLFSHAYNGGAGIRMTRRISRESVALFLLQTKTYAPADFLAGLVGLISKLPASGIQALQAQLPELIKRAAARPENAPIADAPIRRSSNPKRL